MSGPVFHMYHMRANPNCEEYAFYEVRGPYAISVRSPGRAIISDSVFVEWMRGPNVMMNVQENMTLAQVASVVTTWGRQQGWPCLLVDLWYGYTESDADLIVAMLGRHMVEYNRIDESPLRDAYLEMRRAGLR